MNYTEDQTFTYGLVFIYSMLLAILGSPMTLMNSRLSTTPRDYLQDLATMLYRVGVSVESHLKRFYNKTHQQLCSINKIMVGIHMA